MSLQLNSLIDVIIVGGGIAGTAASYYLSAAGARVVLVEARELAAGATAASGGGIRESAQKHAVRQLARRSLQEYMSLANSLSNKFNFRQGGNIRLAENEAEMAYLETVYAEDREDGVNVQLLTAHDVRELVSGITGDIVGALYAAEDGCCHPVLLTRALAECASSRGATILEHTPVQHLLVENGSIKGVKTKFGSIFANNVVLAAGAWTPHLLSEVGITVEIPPRRCQALVTEPVDFQLEPVLVTVRGDLFLRQFDDGSIYICGGTDAFFEDAGFDTSVTLETQQNLTRRLHWLFPTIDRLSITHRYAGITCFPDDRLPVIDRVRDIDGLFVATGFYNGIGIGLGVGSVVAELVLRGESSLDLNHFNFDRTKTRSTDC